MNKPLKTLLYFTVVLSGVFLFACNGYYGPMGRGHMYGYDRYGMGGPFMGIMWIVILVLVGVGIYYIVKNKDIAGSATEKPLDILKKRYAKGEMTKEEYEQMKEDLK